MIQTATEIDEMDAILLDVVKKVLPKVQGVTLESRIREDLGADSLDMMTMVMELEERFELSLTEEEAATIVSLADVKRKIQQMGSHGDAGV
ncbi:MAG: acyl carrier protein [Fibrobacteria bacterium]|nr:acyl carrier protein [Fibrobacteria bacterium]